jgi:hypothetical protein
MEETRHAREVAAVGDELVATTDSLFGTQTAVAAAPATVGALRSGAETVPGSSRPGMLVLRIWLCVGCIFVLISGLSLGLTAEPRTLLVVGGVCIVLGLLGSMIALLIAPSTAARAVPSR